MSARIEPHIIPYPGGITAVDAEYGMRGHAAAHIIREGDRVALVDVGTNSSVPYLLRALELLEIAPERVEYLLLTHIHLDHAGGAGLLLKALPHATALLHPRGAPHMAEPAKLIAGTIQAYGQERFERLYGSIVPIPRNRIRTVADGEQILLGSRALTLLHTAGHALHHYVIVDPAHRCIFTGDSFGVSYRALDTERGAFIAPATVPPQFDPEQAIAAIDRMLSFEPEALYLMHYSRVTGAARLGALLKMQLREFVRIGERHRHEVSRATAIRAEVLALWERLLREQGSTLSSAEIERRLALDLDLDCQGIMVWLDRTSVSG